jgi:hypothetical protein
MVLWRLPLASVLSVLAILEASPASAFYSSSRKLELRELARDTWLHAFDQYKRLAFPKDEVLPLSCTGQGHDHAHPDNGAVNDVMGDYVLTLVDSLDTFPVSPASCHGYRLLMVAADVDARLPFQILGDKAGFEQAIRQTIEHVSFDQPARIQTFEVTIRALGGLVRRMIRSLKADRADVPLYSSLDTSSPAIRNVATLSPGTRASYSPSRTISVDASCPPSTLRPASPTLEFTSSTVSARGKHTRRALPALDRCYSRWRLCRD